MPDANLKMVSETIITLTIIIGGGVIVALVPGNAEIYGLIGMAIGATVQHWFGQQASTTAAQQITTATNGILSAKIQGAIDANTIKQAEAINATRN